MTVRDNKLILKNLFFIKVFLLFISGSIHASIEDYFQYKIEPSASNYGNTGLLEIPNSRFMNEGSLRLSFSSSYPNEFTSITASPFNWFEATYRYTEIKNRNYGPSFYSGNQTYKDKSFDVKIGIIMKLIIFQVLLLA